MASYRALRAPLPARLQPGQIVTADYAEAINALIENADTDRRNFEEIERVLGAIEARLVALENP